MDWLGSECTSEAIIRVYKKIHMFVNLELLVGSKWSGEGLDGVVRV